ncbi:MAG: hypothetical protein DF280_03175 ['Brassica napus' phytoplasma]|nr:MAG: hypothetical protein DF280_03175 ['Brassica napus' phytoplasma]
MREKNFIFFMGMCKKIFRIIKPSINSPFYLFFSNLFFCDYMDYDILVLQNIIYKKNNPKNIKQIQKIQ